MLLDIIGHGPGQLVKIKSIIEILFNKLSWLKLSPIWLVMLNSGTFFITAGSSFIDLLAFEMTHVALIPRKLTMTTIDIM